jgi:two-component system response regulator NreC
LLTRRERQILALIGAGHTNQEIADDLSLSVNTVQAHRSHIIDKLDIHTRAELMRYAIRVGLLRDPG